jgi:DNA-binding CsgD family transcriptional regulator
MIPPYPPLTSHPQGSQSRTDVGHEMPSSAGHAAGAMALSWVAAFTRLYARTGVRYPRVLGFPTHHGSVTIGIMSSRVTLAERCDRLAWLAGQRMDAETFREETIRHLRRIMGFDAWCWRLTDPLTGLPMAGVAHNPSMAGRQRQLFELEYCLGDIADAENGTWPGTVFRLIAATNGAPQRSRRWAQLLGPCGVGDELRARFMLRGQRWEHLVLYRGTDAAPFGRADVALLARLAPLWAQRRCDEVRADLAGARAAATTHAGSVVLLLDRGHHLIVRSAAAERLLTAFPGAGNGSPLCVTALAAWLKAHPDLAATPQVPVLDGTGRWHLAQAHRLDGAIPAGTVAVTLTAAVPAHLAPLAMAAADLTSRERQITKLVLAGTPTTSIARILNITPYTVQDHLRNIFRKFGVNQRRQLTAHLLQERRLGGVD